MFKTLDGMRKTSTFIKYLSMVYGIIAIGNFIYTVAIADSIAEEIATMIVSTVIIIGLAINLTITKMISKRTHKIFKEWQTQINNNMDFDIEQWKDK